MFDEDQELDPKSELEIHDLQRHAGAIVMATQELDELAGSYDRGSDMRERADAALDALQEVNEEITQHIQRLWQQHAE